MILVVILSALTWAAVWAACGVLAWALATIVGRLLRPGEMPAAEMDAPCICVLPCGSPNCTPIPAFDLDEWEARWRQQQEAR